MAEIPEYIRQEAQKELARRYFYDYCQLMRPDFYLDDRQYLKTLCDKLQQFIEQNDKRFLVINMPPRHGKSFTAKNFTEWIFGLNPKNKVMTGSYNETLSTTFARQVRNTIEEKSAGKKVVYQDIFPDTKVKYGEASASIWALEGSDEKSYLATSPTGTATGFGAKIILIDDVIKNAEEAYSDIVKDKQWDWLVNTMLSRTEGDDWKVIIIMTRWATNDLAGRVLDQFDVENINFKAIENDKMLCEQILNKNDYDLKTKEMNPDIVEANYNQTPIDIKGRLYDSFQEYDKIPEGLRLNYTDTADTGKDFLCSVDYILSNDEVYILDNVTTDKPMEDTEPMVAQMLHQDQITEATIESNNGGRGFGRNIERLLKETYSNRCVITPLAQTQNKEARILTSSAWIKNHVYMPHGWQNKWPIFYKQIISYQTKGKNAHDDVVDVMAGIYERATNFKPTVYGRVR